MIKHIIFRPVVLIFEKTSDAEFTLSAYCGRDILCITSMRRVIKLFESNLPGGLEPVVKEKKEKKDKKDKKEE